MKTLTISQMEQTRGGSWSQEAACGLGLSTLMGYALTVAGAFPPAGVAAIATSVIVGGIASMACRGWFD